MVKKKIFPMKYKITLILILFSFYCFAQEDSIIKEPTVVNKVDLERYVGLWYEIAKIPNPFQKKCIKNTTAEYSLRDDGKINVLNSCIKKDGKEISVKGIAKIMDKETCAKLKVSFVKLLGIHLFWGDYWIIGLDEHYQYAIVGEPSRKYGWILSRTPQLSQKNWKAINIILKKQNYNPEDFLKTSHLLNHVQ